MGRECNGKRREMRSRFDNSEEEEEEEEEE